MFNDFHLRTAKKRCLILKSMRCPDLADLRCLCVEHIFMLFCYVLYNVQTRLGNLICLVIQVYELHRLYRIQRDMMDDINRKELHRNRMHVETSLSSSPLASQITSEDARKWHNHGFPMVNSICARPSTSGVEGIHSPLSSMKGNSMQTGPYPSQNGCSSKDVEVLESRPTKVRRKMFDLQLPADEYIDTEEGEQSSGNKLSAISCSYANRGCKIAPESGVKFFLDDGGKTGCKGDAMKSNACLGSLNCLADLNEPIQLEEVNEINASSYDFCNGKIQDAARSVKPNTQLLGFPKEISLNSYGGESGTQNNLHIQKNGIGSGWFSHVLEAGIFFVILHKNSLDWFNLISAFFVPCSVYMCIFFHLRQSPSTLSFSLNFDSTNYSIINGLIIR